MNKRTDTPAAVRRIRVRPTDTLLINGYEISADVLTTVTNPEARLLWAFVARDKNLQAVAYSEQQVIWMEDADYSRGAA
jgi:hypothetical protein